MPKRTNRHRDRTADVLAIFGISGDLAKKMTFRALYRMEKSGVLNIPIIGVALDDWDDEALRKHAREAIEATVPECDQGCLTRMLARLTYVQGDYADAETFTKVKKAIGHAKQPVFYLEIPPFLFSTVVKGLGDAGLVNHAHVVIEKPFGHDLESARALNEELREVLEEGQILRIDHYLGKEPVMDITYLRFANSILEPVWNRSYISHVQMTIAENFGVEDRGRFYDAVGAMRDVIQNHALQVLGLIGMEPPSGNDPDSIRDQKLDFFKAMRAADPKRYVRGQYRGYRDEDGVARNSQTATYAAMTFMIDSWRWQGVPFYLRAGKKLAERLTEVAIHFKSVPLVLFKEEAAGSVLQPAVLTLRIQPQEGISLRFVAKVPGENINVGNVYMNMNYADAFRRPIAEAYERLILDCMRGDATLFNRRDSVDRAWELIQPVLQVWEATPGVQIYEPGSAGPAAADAMLARHGHTWKELVKH